MLDACAFWPELEAEDLFDQDIGVLGRVVIAHADQRKEAGAGLRYQLPVHWISTGTYRAQRLASHAAARRASSSGELSQRFFDTMSDAQQALQSTLLRLCVLCATSLQAIHPSQAPQETVDNEAAKQDGAALSEQIYNDLHALLKKTLKDTTGLSLAMRPPKGSVQDTDAPLAGLDQGSIDAASGLLQSLATDTVPKMAFLANLAQKNATVWCLTEAAANDESVALAKEMGAKLVYGDGAKGRKAIEASVGVLFASEVRQAITEVVDLVAQLCQSFMDMRTRTVLDRAQARREGTTASNTLPPPTRQLSLTLTKKLWNFCDGLAGEGSAEKHVARLPRNNKEALMKVWKQSQLMLQDGLDEVQETIENDDDEEEEEDDDVGAQWSKSVKLSEDERRVAQQVLALLQSGMTLQKDVRLALFREAHADVDYDDVGDAMTELAEAQDDLVAATLYGEEEEEEEKDDDDDDNDDNETKADAEPQSNLNEAANAYLSVCEHLCKAARQDTSLLSSVNKAHQAVFK